MSEAGWAHRAGTAARVTALVVVVLAPVAASFHGLVDVGREWIGLGLWAPLVPLTLDAAALYVAALSWKATLAGDAAGVDRLLVWVYAAASASLNVWHAEVVGGLERACFYGVASLSAAVVWERTLRAARRRELRALGAIDSPAPRFRWLRWLLWPRETAGAWRLAIGEGIPDARRAIEEYRTKRDGTWVPPTLPRVSSVKTSKRESATATDPALVGLSKKRALGRAFEAVGGYDVPAARTWLSERGVATDRSHAYKVAKELEAADSPHLVAVGEAR